MTHTHLTDDQLVALCLEDVPPPQAALCDWCQERRMEIAGLLEEMAEEATEAADAAFPPARIARQYTRILQRLEQHGRLGRVLAFPLSHAQPVSRPRSIRRWVAGAAAAGLIIGVAAGHLAHELPAFGGARASGPQAVLARQTAMPRRGTTSATSDDEFLREIEMAVGSSGPAALRRIDALTPVAWEVVH